MHLIMEPVCKQIGKFVYIFFFVNLTTFCVDKENFQPAFIESLKIGVMPNRSEMLSVK